MAAARTLDLNGDVGEGVGDDAALIPLLTSANVACGAHAGDERSMRAAIRCAVAAGVAIGAHPGHADRAQFGRVEQAIAPEELRELLETQFARLATLASAEGARVRHVKLHGALYHQVARDEALAAACVATVARLQRALHLVGPAGSALERACAAALVPFVREVFADRAYRRDGTLVPRGMAGALIEEEAQAVAQVRSMVERGVAPTLDGGEVAVRAETLCLHGDSPHALAFARRLRRELAACGVVLAAPRSEGEPR